MKNNEQEHDLGKLSEEEIHAIQRARDKMDLEKDASRRATDGRNFAMIDTKNMATFDQYFPPNKERALLDYFIYKMNKNNALIISQKKLMQVLDCSRPTLSKIVSELQDMRFIDVMKIGVQNCYIVNSQVAWKASRKGIKHSVFDATVYVEWDEQVKESIEVWNKPLLSISRDLLIEAKETINEKKAEEDLAMLKHQDKKLEEDK